MDTESQSDSTLCCDCGCCPDDILILTCNHNLCLMCASKNLKNESLKSQHTFQTVVCNTCGLATVLDPESATTLISMFDEIDEENNTPNHNMKSYEIIESPPSKYSRKNVIERTNEFKREPENYQKKYQKNTLQQNKNLYCAEHTEELINYFCFQCNCSNICAECVIHGSHKGHDVQTIKKAYPIICSKLEDLKSNTQANKDVSEQVENIKKRISDVFGDLKRHIERREHDLLKEADDFLDQHIKQIEGLIKLANGRSMNLGEHIQSIKQVINQYDQLGACDFYSKYFNQINQTSASELPQLEEIANHTQTKFQINVQNMNQIMESIQAFKLEVGSLQLEVSNTSKDVYDQRKSMAIHEERGRMNSMQSPNIFELGYKNNTSLKSSVAKTMNKIKQNLVVSERQQYCDFKPSKGSSFRNPAIEKHSFENRQFTEEEHDEEDFNFINR